MEKITDYETLKTIEKINLLIKLRLGSEFQLISSTELILLTKRIYELEYLIGEQRNFFKNQLEGILKNKTKSEIDDIWLKERISKF